MSRNKLKDFLNTQYPSTPASGDGMIAMVSDKEDSGSTNMIETGDDLGVEPGTNAELLSLKNPEKPGGLLGDFVRYLVDMSNAGGHSGNQFIIKGGNKRAAPTDRGDSLDTSNTGVIKTYTEAVDGILISKQKPTLGSVMSSYSQSGKLPGLDLPNLKTGFGEVPFTAAVPDESVYEMNGNTMLSSIAGEDMGTSGDLGQNAKVESVIQESVMKMITLNSRFKGVSNQNFSSFVNPDASSSDEFEKAESGNSGTLTSQNSFGDYVRDPSEDGSDANRVTIDQLKSVAESMLMKSAGWDPSGESPGTSTDPSEFVPDSSSVTSAIPERGISDTSNLRAKNAYGAPKTLSGESSRSSRGDVISYPAGSSYGSLNTPSTPFSDGSSHAVMVAQASAAIIAMMEIANATFTLLVKGDEGTYNLSRGPYDAGHSKFIGRSEKFELFRNIVLIPTNHVYSDCVVQGFLVMFNRKMGYDGEDISNKPGADASSSPNVQQSPGFWLSVARKIIRSFTDFSVTVEEDAESYVSLASEDMWENLFDIIAGNGIVGMLNVAAMIGDKYLVSNGGKVSATIQETGKSESSVSRWNIDALPDGPATRVAKSRSQTGQTALSLAWRGSTAPSIFSIPKNVVFASFEMGTLGMGTNPAKGMLGSQLVEKTYVDVTAGATEDSEGLLGIAGNPRIPQALIEQFENKFDAEYVPFYFHDLRTNEIVGFHAFLENLTDRYTPNYVPSSGYGRIDPVKIYKDTRRALNFSFYAVATSKEDFNEMWFKINKLTSMCYPSWSHGSTLTTEDDSTFVMPFSQVLGASPLIRLRIGDVIKSNYSRYNLARIFGIGEDNIIPPEPDDAPTWKGAQLLTANDFGRSFANKSFDVAFNALFGSPVSFLGYADLAPDDMRALTSLAVNTLGFTNPLGTALVMKTLQSPDVVTNAIPSNLTLSGAIESAAAAMLNAASRGGNDSMGYQDNSFPFLKASSDEGYLIDDGSGKLVRFIRPVRVRVMGRKTITLPVLSKRTGDPKYKTYYTVSIADFNAPFNLLGTQLIVTHEDLMPNINMIFNLRVLPFISIFAAAGALVQALASEAATITGVPSDYLSGLASVSDSALFMNPEFNPITRAFENSGGRGLAGVITSLNYDWLDGQNPWETDWNSRAPMWFKVTVGFDPIHDIPPGLDYNGYNRAPLYNVGEIMRYVAGDPYPDNGQGSKDAYTAAGRLGTVSEGGSPGVSPSGGDDAKKSFQD
jgi:hypothetical protein